MSRFLTALAVLGIVGCTSVRPVRVQAGDLCASCQRTIVDARLAGEVVDARGGVLKFRAPLCMAKYLRRSPSGGAAIFVTDYTTGEMFPAVNGTFVRITVDAGSKDREFAAFRSVQEAAQFMKQRGGGAVDWVGVQRAAMTTSN
jgi:hypothetical protein